MAGRVKSNHDKYKKNAKKTIYDQFEYSKKKKKETKEDNETTLEAISRRLGLPSDILAGAPIITAVGRNELIVENYKNIIEYTGKIIKVQTKLCRITVEGTNLNIIYFNNDEMKITGIFHAIYYK